MKILGKDSFPLNSVITESLSFTRHCARQWEYKDKFGSSPRSQGKTSEDELPVI